MDEVANNYPEADRAGGERNGTASLPDSAITSSASDFFECEARRLHDELARHASLSNTRINGVRHRVLQRLVHDRSSNLKIYFSEDLLSRAQGTQRMRFDLARQLEKLAEKLASRNDIASASASEESNNTTIALSCIEEAFTKEFHNVNYTHTLCPTAKQFRQFYMDAMCCRALHKRFAGCREGTDVSGNAEHEAQHRKNESNRSVTETPSGVTCALLHDTGSSASIVSQTLGCLLTAMNIPLIDVPYRSVPRVCARCAQPLSYCRPRGKRPATDDSAACCSGNVNATDVDQEEGEITLSVPATDDEQSRMDAPQSSDGVASCKGALESSNRCADVPRVRIPCFVSLAQYCSDAPWIADECGVVKDGGAGSVDTSGSSAAAHATRASKATLGEHPVTLGFHFLTQSGVRGERHREDGATCVGASSMGFFADAVNTGGDVLPDGSRSRKRGFALGTSHPSDGSGEGWGDDEDGVSGVHTTRATVARPVVRAVMRGCEQSWSSLVPPLQPLPSCACENGWVGTAREGKDNTVDDSELDCVRDLLDAVRIRFVVEISARIVALELAKRAMMESDLCAMFDGMRASALRVAAMFRDLGKTDSGGSLLPHCDSDAEDRQAGDTLGSCTSCVVHRDRAGVLDVLQSNDVVPISVLELPNTSNLFYCVAYCIGAALLRDYKQHRSRPPVSKCAVRTNKAEEDAVVIIDVDSPHQYCEAILNELDDRIAGTTTSSPDSEDGAASLLMCVSRYETAEGDSFFALLRVWLYLFEYIFETQHELAVPVHSTDGSTSISPRFTSKSKHSAVSRTCIQLSPTASRRLVDTIVSALLDRAWNQTCMFHTSRGCSDAVRTDPPPAEATVGCVENRLCVRDISTRVYNELVTRLVDCDATSTSRR